jgi:hypothetical protein
MDEQLRALCSLLLAGYSTEEPNEKERQVAKYANHNTIATCRKRYLALVRERGNQLGRLETLEHFDLCLLTRYLVSREVYIHKAAHLHSLHHPSWFNCMVKDLEQDNIQNRIDRIKALYDNGDFDSCLWVM